jgi:membrane-associated phospholipid phosphatase
MLIRPENESDREATPVVSLVAEVFMTTMLIGALILAQAIVPGSASADDKYELEGGQEAAVLGSSAVLFGLGLWADQGYEPLTAEEIAQFDPATINWFDRSATGRWSPQAAKASDILVYTTMAAPVFLALTDQGSREAGTLGVMYLETLLLQGGLTFVTKNLFARTRPYVYNDDPDIPLSLKMEKTSRRSFYSGHTSSAFASMVFLASVFERLYPNSSARGWVWGGCMAAAATTGYLRYAAGRHYPTDILVGAAMGAFVGYIVPSLHELEADGPGAPGSSKRGRSMTLGITMGF